MKATLNDAFKAIPREKFLPLDIMEDAILDIPLPIGFGQTNSQPSTVASMLDWLEVEKGMKILDVGCGSGWTSALLAYLTGPKGKVIALDVVTELLETARHNCRDLNIRNVDFHLAGKHYGHAEQAPYDRILVSAAANDIPEELIDQLARHGRMVIPVKNSILVVDKDETGKLEITEHPGYTFVPLL